MNSDFLLMMHKKIVSAFFGLAITLTPMCATADLDSILSAVRNSDLDSIDTVILQKYAEQGNPIAQELLGWFYWTGNVFEQDYQLALKWLEKSANQNNVDAQVALYTMYKYGDGVGQNDKLARKWELKSIENGSSLSYYQAAKHLREGRMTVLNNGVLSIDELSDSAKLQAEKQFSKFVELCEKSATFGNIDCQNSLGGYYLEHVKEAPDYKTAYKWFSIAANNELHKLGSNQSEIQHAQFKIAEMLRHGNGVEKNSLKAIELLEKLSHEDYSFSHLELGLIYYHGDGVVKDYQKALSLFSKSEYANYWIGEMYYFGRGITKNYQKAAENFRKGIEKDKFDLNSTALLGHMYFYGIGLEKDYEKAYGYLERVTGHNVSALYKIGLMYYEGHHVKKDVSRAARIFKRAAEKGSSNAKISLAYRYVTGEGIEQNYTEAFKWYEEAAREGNSHGQFWLGDMYFKGLGVSQDFVMAYALFNLAAATNYELANHSRELAAARLTPERLVYAQQLSKTLFTEAVDKPETEESEHYSGTGFFVNSDGDVVTNYHVIQHCTEYWLNQDGQDFELTVIAADVQNDIAVLKSNIATNSFALLDARSAPKLGEPVVAAGFPLKGLLAEQLNITTGSVSSLAGPNNDSRLLQFTAPIQSGNSGGPLIGLKNQIAGIVVANLDQVKVFEATGSLTQNVNFAIKGLILQTLLDLNGIEYDTTKIWNRKKSTEAIAESARNYVRQITCH